ncbi:cytochrome b5 [Lucilia sericata]|uniref:cytochrome b5 n=1 Tax=Lucilia sericata TaxID=13632 RepID=UPI0018A856A4|nr:cytochrome b5 [Lucilia sericata]
MTTSITSLLQTLRIVPTAGQKQKAQQPPLKVLTAQKAALPEISLDAVAQHDDYCDCWVVIYDRVYDLTSFLQDHPGGADVIMDYAGRDATLAFHGTGHSRDAIEQMRDYLIGELPEHEKIFRCTNGQVIKTGIPE